MSNFQYHTLMTISTEPIVKFPNVNSADPVVDYCRALFNGHSLFTSEIVQRNYTKTHLDKPVLSNWCWVVLDINTISETAYSANNLKSILAMQTIQEFDATIRSLKEINIFQGESEQMIINTMRNLTNRLGITEQLKTHARRLIIVSNT